MDSYKGVWIDGKLQGCHCIDGQLQGCHRIDGQLQGCLYRWMPTGVSPYRWTATGVSLTACGASCSETSHCSSDAFGSCFSENLLSSEMATVSAADTLAADDSVECVTDLTRGRHSQSEAPASSSAVRNVI